MNPPQQAKEIKKKMEEVLAEILELRKHREAMIFLAIDFYSNLERKLTECLAQEPVELTAPYLAACFEKWNNKEPERMRVLRIEKIEAEYLRLQAHKLENLIYSLFGLIEDFTDFLDETTYIQHAKTIRTPLGTIRLRICYGASNRDDIKNPFNEIADYAQTAQTINQTIEYIDSVIEDGIRQIITQSALFERTLGTSSKEVIIYVVSYKHGSGFVDRMETFARNLLGKKTFRVEFKPTPEDIRIFIDIQPLLERGEPLGPTLAHEITHVLDVKSWEYQSYANLIKAEGMAKFAEIINNTEAGPYYPTAFKEYFNRPLSRFGKKEVDKGLEYTIGALMMIQLFSQLIGKEDQMEYALLKRDMQTVVDYFNHNKDKAITILQLAKHMTPQKFFQYYLAKVNNPLLTSALIKKLVGGT